MGFMGLLHAVDKNPQASLPAGPVNLDAAPALPTAKAPSAFSTYAQGVGERARNTPDAPPEADTHAPAQNLEIPAMAPLRPIGQLEDQIRPIGGY